MAIYTIEDKKVLNFYKNLEKSLKEHPELKLDLSNAAHAGLLRMLDVSVNGKPFTAEDEFIQYESNGANSPYEVTEKYALMPMNADGSYVTPAPEDDEFNTAWHTGNQKSLKVGENTIETDLTLDQLNALYDAAQNSRLYAVRPGRSICDLDYKGAYQIFADENGDIELLSCAGKIKMDMSDYDRKTRSMAEFLSSMSEKVATESSEKIATGQSEVYFDYFAAREYKNDLWGAIIDGSPVMSKQEIFNGYMAKDELLFNDIRLDTESKLFNYTVQENGTVRPLFTLDEIIKISEQGSSRLMPFAANRIREAAAAGNLFYRDPDTKDVKTIRTENGRLKAENVTENGAMSAKPRAYGFKKWINGIISNAFSDVSEYDNKQLVCDYYTAYGNVIDDMGKEVDRLTDEKIAADKQALKDYNAKKNAPVQQEIKKAAEAESKEEKAAEQKSFALNDAREKELGDFLDKLEKINHRTLPDEMKSNIRDFYTRACEGVDNIKQHCEKGEPFAAGEDGRTIVAFSEFKRTLENKTMTDNVIAFYCDKKSIGAQIELSTLSSDVMFYTALPQLPDTLKDVFCTDAGVELLTEKLDEALVAVSGKNAEELAKTAETAAAAAEDRWNRAYDPDYAKNAPAEEKAETKQAVVNEL